VCLLLKVTCNFPCQISINNFSGRLFPALRRSACDLFQWADDNRFRRETGIENKMTCLETRKGGVSSLQPRLSSLLRERERERERERGEGEGVSKGSTAEIETEMDKNKMYCEANGVFMMLPDLGPRTSAVWRSFPPLSSSLLFSRGRERESEGRRAETRRGTIGDLSPLAMPSSL